MKTLHYKVSQFTHIFISLQTVIYVSTVYKLFCVSSCPCPCIETLTFHLMNRHSQQRKAQPHIIKSSQQTGIINMQLRTLHSSSYIILYCTYIVVKATSILQASLLLWLLRAFVVSCAKAIILSSSKLTVLNMLQMQRLRHEIRGIMQSQEKNYDIYSDLGN